jgi:hypothetical protein
MSDLLNKASLVVIPSGYKEDVVYSPVPTDGSGDLSFTRASNGTRVNSAGLVEVCPWNYFEQSNNFTTTWATSGASVTLTTGQADPVGGTNATLYARTLAFDFISQSVPQNKYTVFCTVKKATSNFFRIADFLGGDAIFNINTGVVTSASSGITATIESLGNGWYKCIAYFDIINNGFYLQNFPVANGSNGSGSVYIYQAQANIGSTAKPYFPTTDRLNVPRLTYQNGGGGCPSLLLEKQSTNLVTYSEDFTHSNWGNYTTGSGAITKIANQAISPDGTQNADEIRLTRSALTEDALTFQQQYASSSTYSRTIYLKAARTEDVGKKIDIWSYDGSNTVGRVHATLTADWVRFDASTATGALVEILSFGYLSSSTFPTTSGTDVRFYAWGAQGEASSYATSLIPTTSASATRVADACFKTGISSLIGQSQGTFFVDANIINPESPNGNVHILMVGTTTERITIYTSNSGTTINTDGLGGGGYVPISGALTLGRNKIAVAYANNDVAFYVNGNLIGTRTTATIPSSMSQVDVGGNYTYSNYIGSNTYNEVVFFPTRLSNSELQSLTTL